MMMHLIEVLARAGRKLWKGLGKKRPGQECAPGPTDGAVCALQAGAEGGEVGVDSCVAVAISRSRDREVPHFGSVGDSRRPNLRRAGGEAGEGRV
ncbi:hypothetical protein DBR33_00450 [Stenotrophomonas sp. HMWF022]|nr:hypothetical protein DBR20_02550 [Stenotrophomonas sp. HMWF023]PTT58702.1 hypothetical protein DBR33_00450 [Stenotrophomonas sp. HMWF022]